MIFRVVMKGMLLSAVLVPTVFCLLTRAGIPAAESECRFDAATPDWLTTVGSRITYCHFSALSGGGMSAESGDAVGGVYRTYDNTGEHSSLMGFSSQAALDVGINTIYNGLAVSGQVSYGRVFVDSEFYDEVYLSKAPPNSVVSILYLFSAHGTLLGNMSPGDESSTGSTLGIEAKTASQYYGTFVDSNGGVTSTGVPASSFINSPAYPGRVTLLTLTDGIAVSDSTYLPNGVNVGTSEAPLFKFGQLNFRMRAASQGVPGGLLGDIDTSTSVNAINSLTLSGVYFQLDDGSRVTPESLGIDVGFASGHPSPNVLAEDTGHLFVSGVFSNDVREYTLDGRLVRTFVESGSGGLALPQCLRFGPDGHLYVADATTIKKYDGNTGAFLGTFASGFSNPGDLVFDSVGNMLVSDYQNNAIKKFSADGTLLRTYEMGNSTYGLHLTSDDKLLVVLTVNGEQRNTVVELDLTTGTVVTHTTGLSEPLGMALGPDGRYYFGNYTFASLWGGFDPDTIYVVGPEGGVAQRWNTSKGDLLGTDLLTFADDDLFVTSYYNGKVNRFDGATGNFLGSFNGPDGPSGIAFRAFASRSDLNGDGSVDAADAGILFAAWGSMNATVDLNHDGIIDAADAGILFEQWTGDSGSHAIPEPNGLVIATAGGSMLATRRRRVHRTH